MFCRQCGKEISDTVTFCRFCGNKVAKAAPSPAVEAPAYEEIPASEPVYTPPVTNPAPASDAIPHGFNRAGDL